MKKTLILIILIAAALTGVWYYKNKNSVPIVKTDTHTKTYKNSSVGLSFKYPDTLTASTTAGHATLHHEVPFTHKDFCDFKGDGNTTTSTLTDFHIDFHVVADNIVNTMKKESPYIPAENFVNGQVVPSPGFIDAYEAGNLKGFEIFEGAEGCGYTIYYLKVSENKTLVVKNDLITIFTGSIDAGNMAAAKAVPGVIIKENAESIFNTILNTVNVD